MARLARRAGRACRSALAEILAFAAEARGAFDAAVLLGMGGSSLAPEVLRRAFGAEGFHVLDTTHPAAVRRLAESLDPERTLFLVSSKSGTTLETRSHLDFFWELTRGRGESFAAITDPGSELEGLARRARLPGRVPRRAVDRRALLGALAVRDRGSSIRTFSHRVVFLPYALI